MQKETRTIKAQTTVTFSPVTTIIESVVTVTATVDGVEYTIPNVQLRKAGATVVSESSESHAGHDHGHGDHGPPRRVAGRQRRAGIGLRLRSGSDLSAGSRF